MQNESMILGFSGYDISKLVLNKTTVINEESDEGNIGFLFKIVSNKDKTKANLIMGVKIDAIQDFPYNIELIIKGNFILKDCNEDSKESILFTNASAIMYPYLRSILTTVSAQLNQEKVILPLLNFSTIFEGLEKENTFLDSSQFEDFE